MAVDRSKSKGRSALWILPEKLVSVYLCVTSVPCMFTFVPSCMFNFISGGDVDVEWFYREVQQTDGALAASSPSQSLGRCTSFSRIPNSCSAPLSPHFRKAGKGEHR